MVGEIDGEVVGFEVVGAVNGEVVGPPRTRPSNPMDRTAEHDSAWSCQRRGKRAAAEARRRRADGTREGRRGEGWLQWRRAAVLHRPAPAPLSLDLVGDLDGAEIGRWGGRGGMRALSAATGLRLSEMRV